MAANQPSKRTVQLAGRFLEIANRYTAEGWIEHLLWETIEGKRDRPFVFLEPLTEDELQALRALRDEAKIWFFWDYDNKCWAHMHVEVWRPYAEQRTADFVRDQMQAEGVKR